MIVQLSLSFSDPAPASAPAERVRIDHTQVDALGHDDRQAVGFCQGCPLFAVCDLDNCGRRPQSDPDYDLCAAQSIDPDRLPAIFPNLNVFIIFKKLHGWL